MTDGDGRYAILPGAVRTGFCIVAIGLLAVAMSISAATVAYPGPLSAYVARGVAGMLFGSIVVSLASLWLGSWRGTVSQSQNAIAVVVAIFTASLGASGLADERSFTTAWVFLSATTLATGVAAWVLGRLRLGSLARYMPYPVISGFLAATGYLMVMGGLGTAARERLDLGSLALLVEPGAPVRWVPWAAIAVGIACAMRRFRQPMALPFGLLAAGAGFYLTLGVLGIDLGEAGRRGLLLGPFGDSFLAAFAGWSPTSVDGWALVASIPTALTAVGLALISSVLSASSIDAATGASTDADRDLRAIGIGNIIGSLGGSVTGYQSLSMTFLGHGLGMKGAVNGVTVAAASALTLVAGARFVGELPVGLLGAAIIVIGLNMLHAQLAVWRSVLAFDYLVVVIITLVTAVFGFLWGVLVGLVCAAIFFVVALGRIEVVRLVTHCGRLHSRTERAAAEQARLAALGSQVRVYELEGYIFFGTAYRLIQRIEADLAEGSPRHLLLDVTRVRLDTSAARSLALLGIRCQELGVELRFAGFTPGAERLIRSHVGDGARFAPSREAALEEIEATLLADDPWPAGPRGGLLEELARRHPEADLTMYFERVSVAAGAVVIAAGALSDSLLALESGGFRVELDGGPGGSVTLARCLPGALVGEIGLYAGVARTARVVAEEPSSFQRIDLAALDRMASDHPALLADLHRLIARALARRLQRTTALLVDAGGVR